MDLEGKKPAPFTPIYSGEAHGSFTKVLAWPSPSPKSSSSPAVLGEALQDCHAPPSPPRRRAAAGRSLPQPLPLSLLDEGTGDVTGLHVCCTWRCRPFGTRISDDLDRDEYDSFNPVLLNASA